MFGWRKKQIAKAYEQDVNESEKSQALRNAWLPEPETIPPMPEVKPPKVDHGICHYTIGSTTTNHVALVIKDECGYGTTLTMNTSAVRHMIKQLEAAIVEDEQNTSNPTE